MECLKQDIPIRYHKYIPRSYPRANTPESMSCSNISTVNLPIPGSNTLEINRSHPQSPLESSSAAGPPSYRSRSNIQVKFIIKFGPVFRHFNVKSTTHSLII